MIQVGTELGAMLSRKSQRLRGGGRSCDVDHLVKRERVSKYPNCRIDAHKRQRSAHDNSHALNSVPVDQFVPTFQLASIFYPNLTAQLTRRRQSQWVQRG
jgi:hypothetical protein